MADLAVVPKSELVERLKRASSMVKNARKETAEIAERAMGATAALAGGAAYGALQGLDEPPKVPGTDIDAGIGIAAAAILVGITGLGGKASDALVQFGSGMGAAAVADHVKSAMKDKAA